MKSFMEMNNMNISTSLKGEAKLTLGFGSDFYQFPFPGPPAGQTQLFILKQTQLLMSPSDSFKTSSLSCVIELVSTPY